MSDRDTQHDAAPAAAAPTATGDLGPTGTQPTLPAGDRPDRQASGSGAFGPGALLSGRYRLLEELGSGAVGQVFRAEHTLMAKTVAIKVLHADVVHSEAIVARFQQEAQAAARIDHPNVCAATDFGVTEGGAFFMVMEHLEGETLAAVLERERRLPPARAGAITLQVLDALARSHALGIVHRDLKPDNVMLVERDGVRDFVKVLDFGIARSVDPASFGTSKLTAFGMTLGTPQYMSPEQVVASDVDPRSDLYSLGVMLFEMLTGRLPWGDDDLLASMRARIVTTAPTLRAAAPEAAVPEALERYVARLLATRPEDRFEGAEAARAALLEALDGDVAATPARRVQPPLAPDAPAAGGASTRRAIIGGVVAGLAILLIWGQRDAEVAVSDAPSALTGEAPSEPQPDGAPKAFATAALAAGMAAGPVVVADARGLGVKRHVTAREVVDREPRDAREAFTPADRELYCFFELDNAKGGKRRLTVSWVKDGVERFSSDLDVGRSTRWRTWAKLGLMGDPVGLWRCDLVNEDSQVISSQRFSVKPQRE